MIEWAREDDGTDPKHAKLKPAKKYRLTPGQAGIYQDGAIHSIDYPDYARFIRVTGTDLEKINRIKIDLKTGAVRADVRPAGVVNPARADANGDASSRSAPAAVKAMLGDGGELALIDLREELIFSRSHLLWARNVPLSRLELRFAALVPRKRTRIVLIDDNDGLAQRAAAVLAARRLYRSFLSRRRHRGLGRRRLRAVLRRACAEQGVRRIHRARQRHAQRSAPRSSTR